MVLSKLHCHCRELFLRPARRRGRSLCEQGLLRLVHRRWACNHKLWYTCCCVLYGSWRKSGNGVDDVNWASQIRKTTMNILGIAGTIRVRVIILLICFFLKPVWAAHLVDHHRNGTWSLQDCRVVCLPHCLSLRKPLRLDGAQLLGVSALRPSAFAELLVERISWTCK